NERPRIVLGEQISNEVRLRHRGLGYPLDAAATRLRWHGALIARTGTCTSCRDKWYGQRLLYRWIADTGRIVTALIGRLQNQRLGKGSRQAIQRNWDLDGPVVHLDLTEGGIILDLTFRQHDVLDRCAGRLLKIKRDPVPIKIIALCCSEHRDQRIGVAGPHRDFERFVWRQELLVSTLITKPITQRIEEALSRGGRV